MSAAQIQSIVDDYIPAQFDYWLIVDTVRIPDAFIELNEVLTIIESKSLFTKSKFEHLLNQSPLMLKIKADEAALNAWLNLPDFTSSSVAFVVAAQEQSSFIHHLQQLLSVNINGKKMLFRYYTNVIWQQTATQLLDEDIQTILGPASVLIWGDEQLQAQSLVRLSSPIDIEQYHLISPIFLAWS